MKRLIATLALILLLAGVTSPATLTINEVGVMGNLRYVLATFDYDSSYATGGEALTAANLGLTGVLYLDANCDMDGYDVQYDYSAGTLALYSADGDSVSGDANVQILTDDVSAVTEVHIFALGY